MMQKLTLHLRYINVTCHAIVLVPRFSRPPKSILSFLAYLLVVVYFTEEEEQFALGEWNRF